MITNPLNSLHQKHAVYFFNPSDLHKINTDNFENIFLITSNQNESMYKDVLLDNMKYHTKYIFALNQLNISKAKIFPPTFPKKESRVVRGKIYKITK